MALHGGLGAFVGAEQCLETSYRQTDRHVCLYISVLALSLLLTFLHQPTIYFLPDVLGRREVKLPLRAKQGHAELP